jgi:hypothetical protein
VPLELYSRTGDITVAKYNQLPSRLWMQSDRINRHTGKPLWYSVPRRRSYGIAGEIAADELDELFDIERVSDEPLIINQQELVQSAKENI